MKTLKRLLAVVTALAMVMGLCSFTAFAASSQESSDEVVIVLSDDGITVDGQAVSTSEDDAVYISNDIIYYEDKDVYEDTGYTYGEGTDEDKHSEEEAAAHTVVNITEPGTYRVSGTLSLGQIAIDLGDDAKTDPDAVVTLILDGVEITCTVAPAVIFYSVYECDTDWVAYDEEETEEYNASATQDTSDAGANVIIADGSVNTINGSYVAKIYKNNGKEKKLYKFDGAFYSKMSMNVDGEEEGDGVLNIVAENEGLDSELHLTINGGIINIQSQDDGINTNEDEVSVTTINGGSIHILGGLGSEGDGIDSNGYLVINGGVVIAIANPSADSGLDSDMGSYINGGTVLATGSTMDWPESESNQVTMNLQFEEAQDSDEAIIVTDSEGNVVFAYDPDQDETTGSYNRGYQGAVISCAEFTVGETYYVYIGGTVVGEDTNGLYDNSTVTGFTGATRQIYTGTDVGMDNMPGTGNGQDSMGDMGGSGMGDMGNSGMGDMGNSGMGDMGNSGMGGSGDFGGGDDTGVMPISLYDTAASALAEGTTYSNQFYLTDMVNEFSGVQDDPDYTSDDDEDDDSSDLPENNEDNEDNEDGEIPDAPDDEGNAPDEDGNIPDDGEDTLPEDGESMTPPGDGEQSTLNGLNYDQESKLWYYYSNGEIDTEYTGLAQNSYGWWYVADGTVDFTYTGLSYYNGYYWYVKSGNVKFVTGLYKLDGTWYYIVSGRAALTYTGLASNSAGTWYVEDGIVDFGYTGLATVDDTTYFVYKNLVSTATGLYKINGTWYYFVDGAIAYSYTGTAANAYGTWYVEEGIVDFGYTGLAALDDATYYVYKNLVSTATGLYKINSTWYYFVDGAIASDYTGLASNSAGTWYVEEGVVDFGYTGTVTIDGVTYTIVNNLVIS